MVTTIDDAKTRFESEGLYVSEYLGRLWIAANVRHLAGGITMADDSCALVKHNDQWLAVFPAEGMCIYHVPGEFPELVETISAVFAQHRRTGGPLKDAFRQVVSDPDRYVVGNSLAHA